MQYQQFILTYGSESETLIENPDGWNKNGRSWQRDKKYHGVFQSYTVDTFRFSRKSGGGGDFIKNAFDTDDIKANVTVTVKVRNPQTDDYDISYTGKLDFSVDRFRIERNFIDIGFIKNGALQKFTTNDELELDINERTSIDGILMNAFVSQPESIIFPGIDLYRICQSLGNYEYDFFYSYNHSIPGSVLVDPSTIVTLKYWAETIIVNELKDDFLAKQGTGEYSGRSLYLYENTGTTDAVLTFDQITLGYIRYSWRPQFTADKAIVKLILRIYDEEDILDTETIIETKNIEWPFPGYEPYIGTFTINASSIEGNEYTLPPAYKIALHIDIEYDGTFNQSGSYHMRFYDYQECTINLTENSIASESKGISCYRLHEAFTRLFQLMTGQENTFYSEYFGRTDSEFITYDENGQGSERVIVSGWNLREFENKPFALKFNELFKTNFSISPIGCSYDEINERFYIEEISEFYKSDTVLFDIGEVDELIITPFKRAYFNEIEGSTDNDGEYEDIQGTNEFNLKASWSADQPVKEAFNLRAPLNTDSLGIEQARRKPYANYGSEDTDQDDNIFLVVTESGEAKQGKTDVEGFKGIEEYYNLDITPRENLLRHGGLIRPQFWKESETFKIRFRKSKKGINISYENQNGDTVYEFDDIEASEFIGEKLFIPQYYELKGKFENAYAEILKSEKHGVILFSFNNVYHAGLIDEITNKEYEGKADYKLIAAESTKDVQKLFMDDSEALFMDDEQHELL